MVDVVESFLHFTPNGSVPNSIPEMGISSISQERRDESDDYIGGSYYPDHDGGEMDL